MSMMIWLAFLAAMSGAPYDFRHRTDVDPLQDCHLRGDCPFHGWATLAPITQEPCVTRQAADGCNTVTCCGEFCTTTLIYCGQPFKISDGGHFALPIGDPGPAPAKRSLKRMELEGFYGPERESEYKRILHGLVWDVARNGMGVTLDIWSTRYALSQPNVEEKNGLIFDSDALLAVKATAFLGTTLICHELRTRGHHTWATWISRVFFVGHLAFFGNNMWVAHKARQ